jgi:phage terminase small subunit
MARGRRPFETTDVVAFGLDSRRLQPPAGLPEAAKRIFLDTVLACPRTQFQPADTPMLARYAEACALGEEAARELAAHGPVTADGKMSPWFRVHQETSKTIATLATKLRLGPRSRAKMAPKSKAGPVSYYDRMRVLEGERGEDGIS